MRKDLDFPNLPLLPESEDEWRAVAYTHGRSIEDEKFNRHLLEVAEAARLYDAAANAGTLKPYKHSDGTPGWRGVPIPHRNRRK